MNSEFFLKNFIAIFLSYILGISSILRANYDYVDDMLRIYNGSRGWDNFSRYFTEYGSILIHANFVLSDISPLPQIIAMAIMAFSASIIVGLFSKDRCFSIFNICATIPLALSPYFLECLAFKFDSPYMAMSILVTVLPILFLKDHEAGFYCASFLGGLSMCMLYQASNAIYFVLLVIYALFLWINGACNTHLVKKCVLGLISYGFALFVYQKFIFSSTMKYVSTSAAAFWDLPMTIMMNINMFINMFIDDYPKHWLLLLGFFMLCYIIAVTVNSKQNHILTVFFSAFAVFIIVILSQGAYLLLQKTYLQPRAMYGIWCGISIMMIMAVNLRERTWLVKFCCIILSWCVFVFPFMYGNALEKQKSYTDLRVQALVNDLNKTVFTDKKNVYDLKIKGTIGYSHTVKRLFGEYPVMKRLIPVLLHEPPNEDDILYNDLYLFTHNYQPNINKSFAKKTDIAEMQLIKICETGLHDILIDKQNKIVIVVLK